MKPTSRNTLFGFVPSKTGDTSIFLFHPGGRERRDFDNPYSRLSILHNSKARRPPSRLSLFKEVVHWMRVFWMQNDRPCCIPLRIAIVEAGVWRGITFNPLLFPLLAVVLNALPKNIRRAKKFERFFGF